MLDNRPVSWRQRAILLVLSTLLATAILGLGGCAAYPVSVTTPQAPAATPSSEPDPAVETPEPGFPVEVDGRVLFYVRQRIGSLSPSERAALISQRIETLATDPFAPPVAVELVESDQGTDLVAGDAILLTVTDRDAAAVGMERHEAAQAAAAAIQSAIDNTRQQHTPRARALRGLTLLLILTASVLLIVIMNRFFRRLIAWVDMPPSEGGRGQWRRSAAWRRAARLGLRSEQVVILLLIVLVALPLILSIVPATAALAQQLVELLLAPLSSLWSWLQDNQQNLMTIALIAVTAYVLIRIERAVFGEVERGSIRLGGFEPEWAPFTGRLVSFMIAIAAIIVAFPYFPGSDSEGFRGITIFLGALFTLSSTAAVANIVAGVIQTYTGAFKVGDVIKIGEIQGIITEKRLLATSVRTFKNEEVSIPNSLALNTNITNYSAMARQQGLVVYTTITIGYDVPWPNVHELLLGAAQSTPDILPEPQPFVLQTSLNDFHVSYQLNCYINHPEVMPRIYSALHQSIQDHFNRAGIEIMSPAYSALRDGNTVTIPAEHRPTDYQPPGFRLNRS